MFLQAFSIEVTKQVELPQIEARERLMEVPVTLHAWKVSTI